MIDYPEKFDQYFKSLNADLRELIELSNKQFDLFEDKLKAYINFCKEKTQFENILISNVQKEIYTVVTAVSENDFLKKGLEIPLSDTVCKHSYKTKKTLVETKIEGTNLYDLPGRALLNIEAIICTPIVVKGNPIGTLTLYSTSSKENSNEIDYFTNLSELVGLHISDAYTIEKQRVEIRESDENIFHLNSQLNNLVNTYLKHQKEDPLFLQYINLAKEITGFENGFISYINKEHYEIIQASTIDDKLKKGEVFQTCDTICKEVIDKRKTIFHPILKETPQYKLAARDLLSTESIIGIPLYVNNKIWGTFNLYSTSEKEEGFYKKHRSILQLITAMISRILYDIELKNEINAREKLLRLGEDFLQIATYRRYLNSDKFDGADSFVKIFELDKDVKQTEMVSKAMAKVVVEDKATIFNTFSKSSLEDIPPFEYRIAVNKNKVKWLRHQTKILKDEGYVLGVVQDITALKKIELNLKSKNEELKQFNYASAHDLQEPLRTIIGFIELLRQTYPDKLDETGKEYFSYIEAAAFRMKEQIDALLHHSKIGIEKKKSKVNVAVLINDIITDLDAAINKSKAEFKIANLPIINCYEVELRLLFMNLISNAIKFVKAGKQPLILIDFEESSLYWKFTIADNGIGIAKENYSKIFKLFSRLNEREMYAGTGIGLAQVKKIVDLHRGEVFVDSKLGVGSTFAFTIQR